MVKTIRNGISFTESELVARVPDVGDGGKFVEVPLVQRIDPIFGSRARFIESSKLMPETKPDTSELNSSIGFCPFCPENVDLVTFPFPDEIVPTGKIRFGKSLVVPNVMAYSSYSAVGVYDTTRHFIGIDEFSPEIIFDVLSAMLVHARFVRTFDQEVQYSSVNANYLWPSGSSLVHPHMQSSHDYVPLAKQATLIDRCAAHHLETGRSLLTDLVAAELDGARYIASIGSVHFLAPYAPSGFREVWAIVGDATDLIDISLDSTQALAEGIALVLSAYSKWNLASFNFALTGGGNFGAKNGFNPLLRIVARSNPDIQYRSDVTYFEKMYDEAMLDLYPENTAADLRQMFDQA